MERYLVEFSRYGIAFFMFIYTLEAYITLPKPTKGNSKFLVYRQYAYIFIIQFLSFLSMCLKTGQIEYLFFYAFLQISLFTTIVLYQHFYSGYNHQLLNHMCLLLSIGLILLCRLDFQKAGKQFLIMVIGLCFSFLIPVAVHKLKMLRHLGFLYGSLGIFALAGVLILGQVTHGSKISYTIWGITLQPSEFVKILFVFFIASLLYKNYEIKAVIFSAVMAGIHILILAASKDLGGSIIFFVGYLFILFTATSNYLYLFLGLISGTAAASVGYFLFTHVRVRVQAFIDPFTVIDNQGFQIAQSLFAIGHGKWLGTGLFEGIPTSIPFVESDFIFSALAEELGGIAAIAVILICLHCFYLFLRTSMNSDDRFYSLASCGFGVMYIFQIFLTIGGGIKFIPLTGVTLPLVSYGGSSVLSTLIVFSIMQGIHLITLDPVEDKRSQINDILEKEK